MVNGKLTESRLASIGEKFIPMTLMSWASGTRPPTIFAPVKLGMSSYLAEKQIAEVLYAYGDDDFRFKLKGQPRKVKRLETLVVSTLNAAWLNGYSVKDVMSRAKGMAHGKQAVEFFNVLEHNPKNPNVAKLEKIARAAVRTDTMAKTFSRNMDARFERRGRRMTDRQRRIMNAAWQKAREKREE